LEYQRSHVHARFRACLRQLFAAVLLGLAALQVCVPVARAEARHAQQTLAVLPFEIDDNSGEVGAPGRHDAMLAHLTRLVSEKIAAAGLFHVVDQTRVAEAVTAANPGTYLRACNGCERDIAKSVGADAVMIGWLFKMSTLVLSLHVVVKDVTTGDVIYAHTFDFRGDNEKAWQRAADYMVGSLAKRTKQNVPTN
jgi:Protein of unknown function (DUF2380)